MKMEERKGVFIVPLKELVEMGRDGGMVGSRGGGERRRKVYDSRKGKMEEGGREGLRR